MAKLVGDDVSSMAKKQAERTMGLLAALLMQLSPVTMEIHMRHMNETAASESLAWRCRSSEPQPLKQAPDIDC
eukprot:1170565-Pleurochrysis_carterae.AAC.1